MKPASARSEMSSRVQAYQKLQREQLFEHFWRTMEYAIEEQCDYAVEDGRREIELNCEQFLNSARQPLMGEMREFIKSKYEGQGYTVSWVGNKLFIKWK